MDETVPNAYDLMFPSPVTLQEISCIVVVAELWREHIRTQIESEPFQELDLNNNIQLKNVIPNMPSAINDLLQPYVNTFRESMKLWLSSHRFKVFTPSHAFPANILSRFQDFACDWNGTIHYARTAKRMMLCDRLDINEKFKIACFYCFEDDIKRIWPSVNAKLDLNDIEFDTRPELYYWICYLRNELIKIPPPPDESVDEVVLRKCKWRIHRHSSSIKYFWDRLPSDRQALVAIDKFICWPELFCRFILSRLNQHQLEIFLEAKSVEFMWCLLEFDPARFDVLPPWMCIRNKIITSDFNLFIEYVLHAQAKYPEKVSLSSALFYDIWKSAPQHLQRSALDNVVLNDPSFLSDSGHAEIKYLTIVLQDATFEERNALWHKYWFNLIGYEPVADSLELMKLCFGNDDEITLFKENVMSKYENIAGWGVSLITSEFFEKLNGFLSLCCDDLNKIRKLKRRICAGVEFRRKRGFYLSQRNH